MFQKYRIIKMLNSGDYSTVFLVEHRILKSIRIMKRISKGCQYHEQLMNEASILKNLSHPNIPVIYDMEEDIDYSYIIEEYLEGESLKTYRLYQTFIREDTIIDIAKQICNLFHYLHSKDKPILYLDLKPDNIIISHDRIKLIDFGAAISPSEAENRKVSFGTRGFSAPEQYGIQKVDYRSDIYGVGALVYYLLTGTSFSDISIRLRKMDPNHEYSLPLKKIILKCLRRNPKQRYQNMDQLYAALQELAEKRGDKKEMLLSEQPLTIAVAGTQERMGTSHIAMLLTAYINRYVTDAVYIEIAEKRNVPYILRRHKKWHIDNRIFCIEHCRICLESCVKNLENLPVSIRILDYGVMRPELKEELEKANIILVVAGCKEWEFESTHKSMEEFFEYKDIMYILNFIGDKQFNKALIEMKGRVCVKAPFYPDPFFVENTPDLKKFATNILKETKYAQRNCKTKRTRWLRKKR